MLSTVDLFRNSTTQKKKSTKAFSKEREVLPVPRRPETKTENKENALPPQINTNSRIPVPKQLPIQQKKAPSKTPYKTPKSGKKIETSTTNQSSAIKNSMKVDSNPKTPRAQQLLIDQVKRTSIRCVFVRFCYIFSPTDALFGRLKDSLKIS